VVEADRLVDLADLEDLVDLEGLEGLVDPVDLIRDTPEVGALVWVAAQLVLGTLQGILWTRFQGHMVYLQQWQAAEHHAFVTGTRLGKRTFPTLTIPP
jgi:hypothetical protein